MFSVFVEVAQIPVSQDIESGGFVPEENGAIFPTSSLRAMLSVKSRQASSLQHELELHLPRSTSENNRINGFQPGSEKQIPRLP